MLRPALAENKIVLSDRYADATVAYQGSGRGFRPELIKELVQLATDGLQPDLTLLFDLSVAESAVRTRKRFEAKHSDRLDSEDAAFHTRVRDAYVDLAKINPGRVRLIDARGSVQETHQLVMGIVIPFLKDRDVFISDRQ